MYKKIIIQFLLLVVLFGIILSVFFLYFNKEKNQKETSLKTSKILNSEIDNETGKAESIDRFQLSLPQDFPVSDRS